MIDDPTLPAIEHLTGPGADDIIGSAVAAVGGRLHRLRVSQIQYRPDHDCVVRFRADVTWGDGTTRTGETLLAAVDVRDDLPGAIPVSADLDGVRLTVHVWRWPFDPRVPGIEPAVSSGGAAALLAGSVGAAARREVVAYRPTERAVVRLTGSGGNVAYLKAVAPVAMGPLVERHRLLGEAGLPVPAVVAHDPDLGLVLFEELPGPTLRERIKDGAHGLPAARTLDRLVATIHSLRLDPGSSRPGRVADAAAHARLLAAVVPEQASRLDRLAARLAEETGRVGQRSGVVVHGDLHEGQLVVGTPGQVTGLLDVDDLAVGDPLDDHATLIAHLRFRSLVGDHDHHVDEAVADLADSLRASAARIYGADAVDASTAAVLVGLATGPFRIQLDGWRTTTDRVLRRAASLLGVEGDERILSSSSRAAHARPAS